MPPKDRTSEFHQVLSSIRSRSSALPSASQQAKQPLLPNGQSKSGSGAGSARNQQSEFARMAGMIGRDIENTTGKLQKLAQLAKRKTLFDDRPVEISELTYIIRQDISSLNSQIAQLQSHVRSNASSSKSSSSGGGSGSSKGKDKATTKVEAEHEGNVVMLLQSRLAGMGMGFKDVLELRTQNMKASKDRTEQFMHTTSNNALPVPNTNSVLFSQPSSSSTGHLTPSSPSQKGKSPKPGSALHESHNGGFSSAPQTGRASPLLLQAPTGPGGTSSSLSGGGGGGGRKSADFLALDMNGDGGENGLGGSGGQGGYQQMMLVEQQDSYIQSRSTAIESIESTIAELGQIFSQLAGMVAEQRETVQRIDADVTDISANVSGAQRELLKYYASVTSNRWLMMKIFGVLIIFFLVFILVS